MSISTRLRSKNSTARACECDGFRRGAGAVLRRTGFHHLPGLGAGAVTRHVETIGFDYGQRHAVELACRGRGAAQHGRASFRTGRRGWAATTCSTLACFGAISDTALTRDNAIEMPADGLPTTFVPGRNLVFLTFAAALAYRRGLDALVGGMCETDFSGYPDCRDDTMRGDAAGAQPGHWSAPFAIETPLMWLDKADTWPLAERAGRRALVELIVDRHPHLLPGRRAPAHAGAMAAAPARPASCAPAASPSGSRQRAGRKRLRAEPRPGDRRRTVPKRSTTGRSDRIHVGCGRVDPTTE